MGFPFIAPIKEEVRKKLLAREIANNPGDILSTALGREKTSTLSPFAILSTGAMVVKTSGEIKTRIKSIKDLIKSPGALDNHTDAYYGCVISNSTEQKNQYQTGATIAGYDLNGKPIYVEGETNRRVSTPIIESIEIDTDGGNNTLKTAQVKIKVFTLKQLEMFELFFLRPSMNVVLEYGWGTGVRNKSKAAIIEKYLFAKKDFKTYKEDYSALFLDEKKKNSYITALKETEGEYDYMAGRVTDFRYSPAEDGTYEISIEVSSGNELQLWPAVKSAKDSALTLKKNEKKIESYKSFIQKIAADIGRPDFE